MEGLQTPLPDLVAKLKTIVCKYCSC